MKNDVVEINKYWIINICLIIFFISNIKRMYLYIILFMFVFLVDRFGDVMKLLLDFMVVGLGVGF